ncbi:MAG: NEW3 domain-containing protein [Candidatus Aenigmatarchaeota archaeon]
MKNAKLTTIAILCLAISVTLVAAAHTSSISMSPSSWSSSTSNSVSVTVANNGADNIVKIELVAPLDVNKNPLYVIDTKSVTTPQGWESSTTGNYKVTWVSKTGLASGTSLSLFGVEVVSPSVSGNYQWTWTTTDSKNATYIGTVTTTVGQASASNFVVSAPTTSVAGNSIRVIVTAFGSDNQVKTDYTGTVHFTSIDVNAVLPADYTFQTSDYGSKTFAVTYKNSGSQSFTVTDSSAKISKESSKTLVSPSTAVDIGISPEGKTISATEKVEYKVLANDKFGNVFEVTDKATISIDKKAGGTWNKSVYTSQNEGIWVVIAGYNSLVSGTTLVVGKSTPIVVTPTQPIGVNTSTPGTGATADEMTITAPETISIAPGSNDTMIVTVNNNGDRKLSGVEISVAGIPREWTSVYPAANDVPAKSSKDFLVIVLVPANESGTKAIEFTAESDESVKATKSTTLTVTSTPTGSFTLPKNVLQLGVVIIAVAAVVIIGWELWFKKPKSK